MPASASSTIVHAGRVLDPKTGQVEMNVELLITNGVITARGRGLRVPPGTIEIDAREYTIIPGMIDTHVHLTLAGRPRDNARSTLEAGFTTVADLGSARGAGVRLKALIQQDSTPGPRMLAAGSWIGGRGGVCEFGGATIRGATEATERAEGDVAAGADLLKLCVTDWLDPVVAYPDSVQLSSEEIDAVAAVARKNGLPIVAHSIGSAGVQASLAAGVRWLAHTPVVDARGAQSIAAANACVSTTATTLLRGQSADALRTSFVNLRRAGASFMLGTDAGVLPHGENATELLTLAALGFTPLEAIRAATTTAADCLRLPKYGALDEGSPADIVGVAGDPLTNLELLRKPSFVMLAGRVVVGR